MKKYRITIEIEERLIKSLLDGTYKGLGLGVMQGGLDIIESDGVYRQTNQRRKNEISNSTRKKQKR